MNTFMQSNETVTRAWYVIDAKNVPLGRVAAKAASMLRGKHKVTYMPNVDMGDYVVIVNAEKVKFTGKKLDQKVYFHHTGWIGGGRYITLRDLEKNRKSMHHSFV